MASRFPKILLPALGLVCSGCFIPALAQGHAANARSAERADHAGAKAHAGITKEDLAEAISAYVKAETQQAGGTFNVEDPAEGKKLALTLQRVHKARLTMVGPDTYVACTDFSSTDAHMYEIDVFMKGTDKDHLAFSEASVHKKDGVARYSWYEDGGLWRKQLIGAAAGSPEPRKAKPHSK